VTNGLNNSDQTQQKCICGNCRFFDYFDLDYGWCKRFPPVFIENPKYGDYDSWEPFDQPTVRLEDWCGEHQFQTAERIKEKAA
jgi:hypothetical protein